MSDCSQAPNTPDEHRIYQAGFWKLPINASWQEIRSIVAEQDGKEPFSIDLIDWINAINRVCGHAIFDLETA